MADPGRGRRTSRRRADVQHGGSPSGCRSAARRHRTVPGLHLGHSILIPALLGGHWKRDLNVSTDGSLHLNELIGLHLATALALVVSFWRDWIRVIRGLSTSVTQWRIQTVDQRLARLIIMATIPVGVAGIALDKLFRTTLGRPVPTAIFLALKGIVLLITEQLRRGGTGRRRAGGVPVWI
ncbi:undecaprenyl-diphosphate phosphatase [Streptomyces mirabilis]|uniref:undecaprenyl-diphosphate phosphatase n=1 Tax=Streptomyces mirabilis TaxID=68239 RepID=UPI0036EF2825